ncbi:lamin tail domain-containing protein, partial [Flavobacterium sp. j3]
MKFKVLNTLWCRLLLVLMLVCSTTVSWSQLSITATNTTVTQNFDGLPSTGSGLAQTGGIFASGWSFVETGSNGNATYDTGTGSNTAGNTYSFGVAGTNAVSDRGLGMLQSGSLSSFLGFKFTNNTGQTITSIEVGYTGETWRRSVAADNLTFSYQAGNATLNSGSWTTVAGLAFTTPVNGTALTLDGNATANRTVIAPVTITGLSIPDGATFTLRWIDATAASSSAMAIDDFSIRLIATTAPTVTTLAASAISTTGATLNGTVNANGTSTAITFDYGLTTSYGTTVNGLPNTATGSTATSSSASITGLDANTQYNFRIVGTAGTPTNGSNLTFFTLANTPTAPVLSAATNVGFDVAIGGGDANPANTTYAIEVGIGNFVQSNGSVSSTAFYQTATAWATTTIVGLAADTNYVVRVLARNGANVSTVAGPTSSITTLENSAPTLTADPLTAFGSVCITSSATTSFAVLGENLTDDLIINAFDGYSYSTSLNGTYTSTLTLTPDGNGDVLETIFVRFTPTIVQSYSGSIVISSIGATSINVAVTGSGVTTPVNVVTNAASSITSTSVGFAATFTQGCSTVISSGVEYSLTATFVSSSTITSLPGTVSNLQPNTQYFYRAFAEDATGIVFGTVLNFTTLQIAAPVATAATAVTESSFQANWTSIAPASSYRLDVSTSPVFGTFTPTTNLIISEYGEGTPGNRKYIEIYNGTGAAVDLSNYQVWGINNGGNWPESTLSLTGTLANDGKYVIANNAADTPGANLYTTLAPLNFNGDDAIGLAFNGGSGTVFTLLDAVGSDGADPGTGWSVAGVTNATVDRILVRKPTVLSPTTDWTVAAGTNTSNSEWIVSTNPYNASFPPTDLGLHTINNTTPSFVSGYDNLEVNGLLQEVSGLNASTTYYYRVRAVSSNSTSINSNVISVSTAAELPTFGAISQSQAVCNNESATFFISGLLPNSTSTITYSINSGSNQTLTNVIANGSGLAFVSIVLQEGNNGQILAVSQVERTDIVSPILTVSSNNTVTLQVLPSFTWYLDADNDGFGVSTTTLINCVQPAGYASLTGDCNDNNAGINPGATEICWNGVDENCNGLRSEGCAPVVVNMATANNTVLPSFATGVAAQAYSFAGATTATYRFTI